MAGAIRPQSLGVKDLDHRILVLDPADTGQRRSGRDAGGSREVICNILLNVGTSRRHRIHGHYRFEAAEDRLGGCMQYSTISRGAGHDNGVDAAILSIFSRSVLTNFCAPDCTTGSLPIGATSATVSPITLPSTML